MAGAGFPGLRVAIAVAGDHVLSMAPSDVSTTALIRAPIFGDPAPRQGRCTAAPGRESSDALTHSQHRPTAMGASGARWQRPVIDA